MPRTLSRHILFALLALAAAASHANGVGSGGTGKPPHDLGAGPGGWIAAVVSFFKG